MLVLHGTSCLGERGLADLKEDGIIKVNVWTRIERTGAQAVARYTLSHESQFLDHPDLDIFPVNRLRDAFIEAVRPVIRDYFVDFGYDRLVPFAERLARIIHDWKEENAPGVSKD
jgi:fructose/tagatose bisphosphate aldolase